MEMTIKKWGNSLATRIPKAIVDSVGLELDQAVDIEASEGKIIISPKKKKKEYCLEELLKGCSPESMELDQEDHDWLDDEPSGREVL